MLSENEKVLRSMKGKLTETASWLQSVQELKGIFGKFFYCIELCVVSEPDRFL